MAPKARVGSFRPIKSGEPGRYELRVSGGPDPARPGKYLLHREVIGPLNDRGKPLTGSDITKALNAFVTDVSRGKYPLTSRTFGQAIDKYLKVLDVQERENSTLRTYRGLIRKWIRPRLGGVPMAKLTVEHFNDLYTAMGEAGRSASTVNQAHAVCRKVANLAITWGWISANPTKGTVRPPVRRPRRRAVAPLDLANIVLETFTENPTAATFFLVAAGTAERRGEVSGIRWTDIDWEAQSVKVVFAIGIDDDGSAIDEEGYVRAARYGKIDVEAKDPKDHQERDVDLPLTVVRALREHRKRVLEIAKFARVKVLDDGFVFSAAPDGSLPPRPDWFTDVFAEMRDRVGVASTVKMKDLRHLYATLALANGIPLSVVRDLLGHESGKTTMDFYVGQLPGGGSVAAAVVEDALGLAGIADRMGLPKESDPVEADTA